MGSEQGHDGEFVLTEDDSLNGAREARNWEADKAFWAVEGIQ